MAIKKRGKKDSPRRRRAVDKHKSADSDSRAPATALSPEEAELLLRLYREFSAGSEFNAGLQRALAIIGEYAGWDLISVWLPTEDERQIEPFVFWHRKDSALNDLVETCQKQAFAPGVGMIGRVWNSANPEWITEMARQLPDRFALTNWFEMAGLQAVLAAPIVHGDRAIGVLMCAARRATAAYHSLARTVSYFADQLGLALRHEQIEQKLRAHEESIRRSHEELELRAIERTVQLKVANEALHAEILERKRLHKELQRRVRQQEAVVSIGQRILSQETLPVLLQEICERVAQTLEVEFCKILELQPDGQVLVLRAGVGWRDGLVGAATVSAGDRSQAGYTLTSSKPVIVEDLQTERRFSFPQLLLDHGVVSSVSVVIAGQSRPFGVLGAHDAKRRHFSAEDVNFLESVAHVLSETIDRRNSVAVIRKSETWLRNLIATTQDGVVSIDRRGCVVLFNRSAERIFGYRTEEIVGRKVNELMAEPYSTEHDGYIERYERTGQAKAIGRIRTVRAKRKSGEVFPIELSVTEIAVDDVVHYAAFIRDISRTVELQARAVENERLAAIGGTAARIGHEIANPLNGIYLTLQLVEQRLTRQPSNHERVTADIANVKREVGRLNQLVQEFRSLARKQEYDFRATHLPTIIDEVLDLQRSVCESQGIAIKRSDPPDLPKIEVDEDKLKQALLNLVKNAIEAMTHGGELTVATASDDKSAIITVSDTGVGISPGTEIFAPFFTTKKEGTGLGLIVVRQIVSAHGGQVYYESRLGGGTEFRIILPYSVDRGG